MVEKKTADSLALKRSRRERQISPERTQESPKEDVPAEPQTSETINIEPPPYSAIGKELREGDPETVDSGPPPNPGIETKPRERDALDDIIKESKATSHLVSILCLEMDTPTLKM